MIKSIKITLLIFTILVISIGVLSLPTLIYLNQGAIGLISLLTAYFVFIFALVYQYFSRKRKSDFSIKSATEEKFWQDQKCISRKYTKVKKF